jgi:hypothetical protein
MKGKPLFGKDPKAMKGGEDKAKAKAKGKDMAFGKAMKGKQKK